MQKESAKFLLVDDHAQMFGVEWEWHMCENGCDFGGLRDQDVALGPDCKT